MLGPKTLTRVGLQHSLEQLLDFLPATARDAPKAWVYAGRDTDALSRVVQRWRKPSNAILRRAYRADAKYTADLHVFAPTPVNAPGLVRDLLKQDVPFAVLIPSDLVQCVSEVGRKVDKALQRRVAKCAKLTFLAGGLTWVVGGLGTSAHLILAGTAVEDGAGGGQEELRSRRSRRRPRSKAGCEKTSGASRTGPRRPKPLCTRRQLSCGKSRSRCSRTAVSRTCRGRTTRS